ncbi:MAG: pilus assembly protein PilM [Lachnospiraceae bacterium]|nr:pilus assembly protein PilM [Lachnospiraceae bacterium]
MEQKLLSIYVGNEVTRVCEVVKKSASMVVVNNATEVATPTGAMDDGYLTDVPAIAEAIRGCVFGRGFSASKVIFTISSKKIANKEVVIPYVRGDKKVAAILEANSSEYFPMSTTGDFLFAHSIMETFQDVEGKKLRLTAVAAPRDLVECYYELADELRLTVEDIDYVGNSVLQLLSLQMKEGDTELVLQIEKDMTFVNVMSGKSVILQRSVPYGKNAVINSMMEIKKLTEKEAKTLLSNRDMLDRQVTEEEYAEAVRYLISSIGRIVEYHRSRNPDRIIDGIRVFGEGSAIAGIDEVLKQELGAQVTHFSTLQGIKAGSKSYLTSETALRYLANFGAVLNPIGLNLNRGKSKESVSRTADKVLYAILIVAIVAVVGWVVWTMVAYYGTKAVKEKLEADIKAIEDVEQIAADYESAKAAYDSVMAFANSTYSNNELVLRFIQDLEQKLPKDTIINNFSSVDGFVEFAVTTPNKEAVADVIVAMREIDYVQSFSIPALAEEEGVIPGIEEAEGEEADAEDEEVIPTVVVYEFSCVLVEPAEEGGAQ